MQITTTHSRPCGAFPVPIWVAAPVVSSGDQTPATLIAKAKELAE